MLLLDEPTNHLDAESVAWLQNHLDDFPGCVILVTHDRYFLDQVTNGSLELDRGQGIPYEGNYSVWLEKKAKRLAQEEREEAGRQKCRSTANSNGSALSPRRGRPSPRRASTPTTKWPRRPSARRSPRRRSDPARARASAAIVIEVEDLNKAFGDKLLIEDLSFKLPPGGIVGVIGPNGAGKTTLFKMITGQEKPDGGAFKRRRDA